MKVLVLGGGGFIGSHLVEGLRVSGHSVRVLVRSTNHSCQQIANVEYRFGDFADAPFLAEALEGVEVVYHLISSTVPSTSNLDPVADVQVNLINTLRLLRLMVDKNISKIVFLSSGGTVYGIPEMLPIPESHPLRPICSYGVVKVAIENYLHMFHQLYGLNYTVLRASNPYGERQGHVGVQGVIGTFMSKILANEPIEIWGDGSVVRDYIYVTDLVALCVVAGQSQIVGTYNAGSGVGNSIIEISSFLKEVSGERIEHIFRPSRGYDVPRVVLDVSSALFTFDWSPKVCLLDGIERTWRGR